MLDELSGGFALGLPPRLPNASLGHTAEIIVHTWRPACCRNVEPHGFGDTVGMSQRTRPPISGLVKPVEADRAAVETQCEKMASRVSRSKAVSTAQRSPDSRAKCSYHCRCLSSTALATTVSLR